MNTDTITDISTDEEDFKWIREFRQGSEQAFNRLVLKHKNRVYNLCFSMVGASDDANDLAQETFVKMYKGLHTFRMEAKLTTWLYRVAVNLCKNRVTSAHFRRKKQSVSLESAEEFIPQNKSDDPESNEIRRRQRMAIQECVDALPADQKEVVLLKDMDGLPYEDITGIIKQTLGTVKSRLFRAREKLRHCLEGRV